MKKNILVLFILIFSFGLFIFNVAPSKASAYTCTASILTPSVKLGETAKVKVDISNASEPVYVFASPYKYGTAQGYGTTVAVVQSMECSANSCTLELPYTSVAAPSGSVTVDAVTYGTSILGNHSFNIFCSTNKPFGQNGAVQGLGPNDAHEVINVTAGYTIISGGQDCELTGPGDLLLPPRFNGGTIPPNYSLEKSGTKTFTLKNSGSVSANLAINSSTAGVTASLGATTLAGGASTLMAITFSGTASRETFDLTSSCGGATHTYHLTGEVPFVCTGSCVDSPPPPPPNSLYVDGDFPIVVSGGDVTITEGQTVVRDVVVGNPKGYVGNVKIFTERMALPLGVNATFSPINGTLSTGESFHTKVTFKADGLVLAGTYKYQLTVEVKNPSGYNMDMVPINTKNLNMTTQNKVIPAKDVASMPATINTLRTYEAKELNLRLESPGTLAESPSFVGSDVMSVKSWTNPVMILDKNAGRGEMGARYFSLADPMNPVRDFSKDLVLDNRWAGDYGAQMHPLSIAYSRDGRYEISNQWNQGTLGSTPEYHVHGEYTGIPFGGVHGVDPVDIFQSNSHVYFTSLSGGGVTRLDGVTKSVPYLNSLGGETYDWIYPELPDTAPNIPGATATMEVNTTVMAGAKDYVAVLTGSFSGRSLNAPNKLSIYGTGDSPAVAEIAVNNVPTNAEGVGNLTSFVTSDVQYVMFTAVAPLPISPTLTMYDPQRYQNFLYVYKFDPATNVLTKIAEGLKFAGQQTGLAGIRVGKKDGLIMLLYDDMAKSDHSNPAYSPMPLYKPVIYMFSDLSAGRFKDVFQDAGYSTIGGSLASLNVGVSTYVYLNAGYDQLNVSHGIAVLKFDPSGVNVGGSSSPVATCQDSTSLNYGGTLPCRYPLLRPACSPGDLFDTDTGLPCDGTTGTGGKLNCVNISSSIYCSNGQVRGATAFHFTQWLALGSSGNEVLELQKFLKVAGYDTGVADGNFGAKTEAAVIKLQIANGLKSDGIVGALTRAVLNK